MSKPARLNIGDTAGEPRLSDHTGRPVRDRRGEMVLPKRDAMRLLSQLGSVVVIHSGLMIQTMQIVVES